MFEIPESLKTALHNGRVLPFVGAGVSMAVRGRDGKRLFPGWRQLLLSGADRLDGEGKKRDAGLVRLLVDPEEPEYLEAARRLRKGLKASWSSLRKEQLSPRRRDAEDESLGLARAVWELGSPLILTTNYDRVLRWTCPNEGPADDLEEWDVEARAEQVAFLRQGRPMHPTVWHLHGRIENVDRLILTPDGYRRLYPGTAETDGNREPPEFAAALATLRTLLTSHTFLFLGFSLEDESFAFQLESVSDLFGGHSGPHYALIHQRDRERFQGLGLPVEPLVFEDFGEPLLEAVRRLGREAAARPAEPAPPPREAGGEAGGAAVAQPAPVVEQQRYADRLRAYCDELPVLGFDRTVRLPLSLDDIYVPLQAEAYGPGLERGSREKGGWDLREMGGDREVAFDEVFPLAERLGYRCLVVLGDPGSDKTTLLKHFVLALTGRAWPNPLGLPLETLPVLVELRALKRPEAGLRSAVEEMVGRVDLALKDPAEFARQLVERDGLLVLVDGLDEIAADSRRAAVARWLESAARILPRSVFVVTSRFAGYQGVCRLGGAVLELRVRDLEEPEARRFIQGWYGAVERQATLGVDEEVAAGRARERSAKLEERIFDSDDERTRNLRDLARNPMMLQILCLVHRDRRYLPERRVELYQECVLLLLALWRERDLPVSFTPGEALAALQPLAWWLQSQCRQEASLEELLPPLKAPLREGGWDPAALGKLLEAIRDESGVLVTKGDGSYAFLHLSLQEYLAARHLQSQCLERPELVEELADHYGEKSWREVLLLALGLDTPSLFAPVMSALLNREVLHRDPLLAGDCLRDAAKARPDPFLEALEGGLASAQERHQVLQLLKTPELEGWRDAELDSGATGQKIVRGLRESDESEAVRGLAGELLGRGAKPGRLESAPAVLTRGKSLGVTSFEPESGEERVHEKDGSVLVYVPGGEYRLGAEDVDEDSKPIHTVTLSPFWLGKYPVTNAQYGKFLEATAHDEPGEWKNKRFNQPEQPVVGVSWHDALAYCDWAGLGLPSEAQWEAAARGSDDRRYPWGAEEPTEERANFGGKVGRTSPVGSYPKGAGPFGVLDQAGNVWEWCVDVWNERAYDDRDGQRDPVSQKGEDSRRVVRGGSWAGGSGVLPAAFRFWFWAEHRLRDVGFRVFVPAEP